DAAMLDAKRATACSRRNFIRVPTPVELEGDIAAVTLAFDDHDALSMYAFASRPCGTACFLGVAPPLTFGLAFALPRFIRGRVDPSGSSGSQHRVHRLVAGGFVSVGFRELVVGQLQDGAAHAALAAPVELDDGMMRASARRDELRIVDLEQRLLESDNLVGLPAQQSAERRHLHRWLLKRSV